MHRAVVGSTGKRALFPGCPSNVGSYSAQGVLQRKGCHGRALHTLGRPSMRLITHRAPGDIPSISLPWIRALDLAGEASQGFR